MYLEIMDDIGLKWQRLTGHYYRESLIRPIRREERRKVILPTSSAPGLNSPLNEVLKLRRSKRNYSGRPMSKEEISYLTWAAYGVNDTRGRLNLHTAPSAGATYPLELYLVIQKCVDFDLGLYRYDPTDHGLIPLALRDLSRETAIALLDQDFVARAGCTLIWTAVIARCSRRYLERAYRYVYLEAGHQAQNALLAAAALDLSACPVGAFFDDEVSKILGVDSESEFPLYAVTLGHPA